MLLNPVSVTRDSDCDGMISPIMVTGHNGKQVVNRLKIPQGLSALMFRRWSEVPSRGGGRGD